MKKLLMICNTDWFFISHRLVIAKEAIKEGWIVYVACENTGRANEISNDRIKFIDFKFSRSGTNFLEEASTFIKFYKLYKKVKPDIVHHITLKPVTYGSIIAKVMGIKGVVNAVSGLGYNFTANRQGFVQKLMIKFMRFGFNKEKLTVIFQNRDDQYALEKLKIINNKNIIVRIKGSGVDLNEFYESQFPSFDRIIIVLPIRMLWDKGVRELREASTLLKEKYQNKIQFVLSGLADEDNKAGVPESYLNDWQDGYYVTWIGYQKNMVEVYRNSHIVILPSYREGMPKTLIEGCAIGRAIITTDAIGCRECVDEGVNGLKVPVYSVNELAEAIEKLVLAPDLIKTMGRNSRIKAEQEFDVKAVISKHLEIYSKLLDNNT